MMLKNVNPSIDINSIYEESYYSSEEELYIPQKINIARNASDDGEDTPDECAIDGDDSDNNDESAENIIHNEESEKTESTNNNDEEVTSNNDVASDNDSESVRPTSEPSDHSDHSDHSDNDEMPDTEEPSNDHNESSDHSSSNHSDHSDSIPKNAPSLLRGRSRENKKKEKINVTPSTSTSGSASGSASVPVDQSSASSASTSTSTPVRISIKKLLQSKNTPSHQLSTNSTKSNQKTTIYCDAIYKTGKNKGHVCNRPVFSSNSTKCKIHGGGAARSPTPP